MGEIIIATAPIQYQGYMKLGDAHEGDKGNDGIINDNAEAEQAAKTFCAENQGAECLRFLSYLEQSGYAIMPQLQINGPADGNEPAASKPSSEQSGYTIMPQLPINGPADGNEPTASQPNEVAGLNEPAASKPIIDEVGFYLSGSLALGVYAEPMKGGPLPANLRYVPVHPDDSYASEADNGPISPDTPRGTAYTISLFNLQLGLQLRKDDIYCTITAGADLVALGPNDHERNYTNNPGSSQRGYGAALTYYGVGPVVTFGQMSIIPNVDVNLAYGMLNFGVKTRVFPFGVNTGWDRYDSLENYQSYALGAKIDLEQYIGISFPDSHSPATLDLFGGNIISFSATNSLGKSLGYNNTQDSWFAGLGATYRFYSITKMPW